MICLQVIKTIKYYVLQGEQSRGAKYDLLPGGTEGPKCERIVKDKYEKDAGTNVKGPKETEYKQLKVEAEYQGRCSWESAESRESYIIEEVANTQKEDRETIAIVD